MRTSKSSRDASEWPLWQTAAAFIFVTASLYAFPVTSALTPACPTAFWNFGDSLTDTGSVVNAFPQCPQCDPESSPYGDSFFGRPAKRFSNGRVVPDFFALAFFKPLLQPYIQAGAFDYRFGANFASAGTTASNDTTQNPLFLPFQISEFVRLKRSAASEKSQLFCAQFLPYLPFDDSYSKGLYTIEIGGNDILNAVLLKNMTAAQITGQVIPAAMANIAKGIETLYNNGARQFLFFNLPNAGCSTIVVTLLGSILPTDASGCVIPINLLDQAYNAALNGTIASARTQYPSASFTIFNYYAANEEILNNPTQYGFNPNLTKTACCGAPGVGNLNYNPLVTCGKTGSTKCSNPEEYVNWDGIHFTEAFYRVISKFALNGQFTDTGFNYTANCFLNFNRFGPDATFDSTYPATCKVTFT
ncbi:hypothetical protein R1flu_022014 [Riccia fluitans]|uniref:Uncharacterized protein n=1 Tax=Riccia fluitans TaxID=41844 RepID=A0ABD1ZSL2_9MARC